MKLRRRTKKKIIAVALVIAAFVAFAVATQARRMSSGSFSCDYFWCSIWERAERLINR